MDYTVNADALTVAEWDEEHGKQCCPLCEASHDDNAAYQYLKQLWDCLAARGVPQRTAAKQCAEAFRTFVQEPLEARGEQTQPLSQAVVFKHFTEHDISTTSAMAKQLHRTRRLLDAMPVVTASEEGGYRTDAKNAKAYTSLLDSHITLLKAVEQRTKEHTALPLPPDIDAL